MHMAPIAGVLAYVADALICGCDMPTSNLQHQEQWTARLIRFSVVISTILLSALLVLIGSNVQAKL